MLQKILFLGLVLFSMIGQSYAQLRVYETFDEFEHLIQTSEDSTYIINFWATWCKPCLAELPYFEEANQNLNSQKVKFILVSLDDARQLEKKVIPFVEKQDIQSKVVLLNDDDYNYWIDKVSPEWSGSIPATLIFDKHKKQFLEHEFSNTAELETFIHQFLQS